MLTKDKIKQSFASASCTYDQVALLQRKVGISLLEQVELASPVDTLLDLGCGTGFLIQALLDNKADCADHILAVDIAFPMLQAARTKLKNHASVTYLCADVECLPLLPQSVDVVLSNLALQWCDELAKVFNDINSFLKPDCQFYFTTFGPKTLHELKAAWQQVDAYAHVNMFYSEPQLLDLLGQANFKQVKVETRSYVSVYESVWDLMAELKQLGAHTVLAGGNKGLTSKAAMQCMIGAYQNQHKDGLIPATFEVIMVSAKA